MRIYRIYSRQKLLLLFFAADTYDRINLLVFRRVYILNFSHHAHADLLLLKYNIREIKSGSYKRVTLLYPKCVSEYITQYNKYIIVPVKYCLRRTMIDRFKRRQHGSGVFIETGNYNVYIFSSMLYINQTCANLLYILLSMCVC